MNSEREPPERLDPDSPRGRQVADQLEALFLAVDERLAREQQAGRPAA